MKTLTILFIVLITTYSFPQENVLSGKHKKANVSNLQEVHRIKSPLNTSTTQVLKPINISNKIGVTDTLSYFYLFSNKIGFGLFGQDWLIQWFRAPASLWIKGLGFYCDDNPNNTPAEVKIVKVNWTEAQLISADTLQRGYYEALGNGYNDITSFLDNPDRTGDWTSIQSGDIEPFEHDIWSNNGVGYTFIPDETLKDFQWIDMNVLGDEPYLSEGEIFGVALKNTSANLDGDGIFFSAGIAGYPGWKFYANGRWIPGVDYGWWTKEYTFDFRVAVDIISGGIYFYSITYLSVTLSTEPREVFANILAEGGVPVNIPLISKIFYSTNQG
ncbi:MAG: hypothetical protein MUO34_12655, partial [Ignavibacteriaceae bacterium]|nr:hypothetical protein [Ignavibacteriaceae bacterium]